METETISNKNIVTPSENDDSSDVANNFGNDEDDESNTIEQHDEGPNEQEMEVTEKTISTPLTNDSPRCCMCQIVRSAFDDLKDHVLEVHGELPDEESREKALNQKRYFCELCGRSFRLKSFLQAHFIDKDFIEPKGRMPKGKIPKKGICDVCDSIFGNKQELQLHMRQSHPDYKPFVCDFEGCNKSFTEKPLLRRHKIYHRGRNFVCDICGRHFVTKPKMLKHRFIHTETKPLQCPQCPRTFTYGHVLKAHILTHKGKQFKCEMCNKRYKWKEDLRNHCKTEHLGIFPFKCQHCGKGYSGSTNKNYHENKCLRKP